MGGWLTTTDRKKDQQAFGIKTPSASINCLLLRGFFSHFTMIAFPFQSTGNLSRRFMRNVCFEGRDEYIQSMVSRVLPWVKPDWEFNLITGRICVWEEEEKLWEMGRWCSIYTQVFFRFNVLLSCQHEGQMFSTLPLRDFRRFKDLKIKTLKLLNKETRWSGTRRRWDQRPGELDREPSSGVCMVDILIKLTQSLQIPHLYPAPGWS